MQSFLETQHLTISPVTLLDTLEGQQYEGFDSIPSADDYHLVCTKLDDKSFTPNPDRPKPKAPEATLNIAHLANGPWAHFLPVVKV